MDIQKRLDFAIGIAREAGAFASRHFAAIDSLVIESKGHQDLVSNADKETEKLIRSAIAAAFPDDGIVGEEYGRVHGTSGFDWVIDPIDGTANFVRAIPQWCVALAVARHGDAVIGVINEPSSGELFHAMKGGGAFCNGKPILAARGSDIGEGSVGTGYSGRAPGENIIKVVARLVASGSMFFRNASGALMLAYVAAGRLLGYVEEHMNSWDCLGGLLIIEEAGGVIVKPDAETVLEHGTVVIAAGPNVFGEISKLADDCFSR